MKKLLLSVVALSVAFTYSCNLMERKRIDMTQVNQFQDSIPKIIPGVRSIHTIQKDDLTKVMIIVGAPSFYDASADKKQQAAINTGLMVLYVLGADNNISTGTLVISKKDNDSGDVAPADGINVDMKIDSLKKIVFPK